MRAFSAEERVMNPRPYAWAVGAKRLSEPQLYLDQGQEGACVGFGFAHEAAARPVIVHGVDSDFARKIYFAAQKQDPWPGGAYPGAFPFYEGTSVLAGAQVLQKAGAFQNYFWAKNELEMAIAVGYKGPVVIGVNWYEGMMRPDRDGYLRPTGRIVGGHCTLVMGIRLRDDTYIIHNSWGKDWGIDGRALIARKDMERLLSEDGEACLPMRREQFTKFSVN